MVNEMLSWMEQHELPFVATTNLAESLDRATSRRFLFKLTFEYLDEERAGLLFERIFGLPAPTQLRKLDELTAADFDVVARRAALLGINSASHLIEMLREELEGRAERRPTTVGFSNSN